MMMMNDNQSDQSDQSDQSEPMDLSAGYCVKFYVYGDGSYGVGEPTELDKEEQAEEQDEDASIPDLTTSLKRLLNVVKAHPIGESDEAQFDAGFKSGPAKGSMY